MKQYKMKYKTTTKRKTTNQKTSPYIEFIVIKIIFSFSFACPGKTYLFPLGAVNEKFNNFYFFFHSMWT